MSESSPLLVVEAPKLQGDQMLLLSPSYGAERRHGIERDEASAVPDGQREEVQIGELARTVDAGGVGNARVEQADVVGSELVAGSPPRREDVR